MNIKKILQSRDTMRFHNHSGIPGQLLSDHQWGAAMILNYIYSDCSKDLLFAVLTHDVAEYYTGDIPAPVKWKSPAIKRALAEMETLANQELGLDIPELTPFEEAMLHSVDAMEGMWYCIQQMKDGYQSARRPFRNWEIKVRSIMEEVEVSEAYKDFFQLILEERQKWDISMKLEDQREITNYRYEGTET